jgi:hypothetical protein
MRTAKLLMIPVVIAGLMLILVWAPGHPIGASVAAVERSTVFDDAGGEFLLVTLRLTNQGSAPAFLLKGKGPVQGETAHGWVEAENLWSPPFGLWPGQSSEMILLVPAGSVRCRLALKYCPEQWQWRLWALLGGRGQQALRSYLPKGIFNRLWPNTRSLPPESFAPITVEAPIPTRY